MNMGFMSGSKGIRGETLDERKDIGNIEMGHWVSAASYKVSRILFQLFWALEGGRFRWRN